MVPKVSVIIASYNHAQYLPAAISSVLAQSFSDLEMLVIDDGSTDATPEAMRPFLDEPRLRYLRTENRGQPAAANVGIGLSRGELLAFLDADDVWLPQKLQRQVALFDDPETGVVYCRRQTIDPQGRPLFEPRKPAFRGRVLPQAFHHNFICFSSSMVRRSVVARVGPFDEQCYRTLDYDLWLRAAVHYQFDYVDEPLVLYRMGHPNPSRRVELQYKCALRIMDRFVHDHPGLLDPGWVRKCYGETYHNFGVALRERSRRAALPWQWRAVAASPGSAMAWKSLLSLFLPEQARRFLRRALGRRDWTAIASGAGGQLFPDRNNDVSGHVPHWVKQR